MGQLQVQVHVGHVPTYRPQTCYKKSRYKYLLPNHLQLRPTMNQHRSPHAGDLTWPGSWPVVVAVVAKHEQKSPCLCLHLIRSILLSNGDRTVDTRQPKTATKCDTVAYVLPSLSTLPSRLEELVELTPESLHLRFTINHPPTHLPELYSARLGRAAYPDWETGHRCWCSGAATNSKIEPLVTVVVVVAGESNIGYP